MRTSVLIVVILCSGSFARNLENLNEISNRESRIVNGADATEGQFPYHAILKGETLCGGSIIGDKWILTAAHCLTSKNPDDWTIVVGTILLNAGTEYAVDKVIVHDEFSLNKAADSDVALLKLKENITFSDNVQKIELEREPVGEVDCVISGFGLTSSIFHLPSIKLQYLNTRVTTGWLCSEMGGSASKICTKGPIFSTACSGDSGGPLVADGKQIGIVSYGSKWCLGILPTVYTSVPYFLPWIEETIQRDEQN